MTQPRGADDAAESVGRVLSAVIATTSPDVVAVIWRWPRVTVRPPVDFAARGALELLLHGHDVCAGLSVPLEPPNDLCTRLINHTRGWPHWTAPGWGPPPRTGDGWADLLAGSGRAPSASSG
jgi:hypothetical protein